MEPGDPTPDSERREPGRLARRSGKARTEPRPPVKAAPERAAPTDRLLSPTARRLRDGAIVVVAVLILIFVVGFVLQWSEPLTDAALAVGMWLAVAIEVFEHRTLPRGLALFATVVTVYTIAVTFRLV